MTVAIDPKLSMLLSPTKDMENSASPASQSFQRACELVTAGNATDAYPLFVSTVSADPSHAAAWFHIGTLLYADKKFPAARAAMERVNQLKPNEPRVLTNLGWYCHTAEDTDAAYHYLKKAIELGPDLALGWSNLSQIEIARCDLDAAVRYAQRGVDLAHDGNPMHVMSLAFAHLFRGDLQIGLRNYEARFRYKLQQFLSYAYPLWDGRPVETLFLRAEQGIGDTITTLRFLPEVARLAKRTLCYVNSELRTLVEDMNLPGFEVKALPAVLPAAADAWLPMMSLPLALKLETSDVQQSFAPPYVPVYDKYPPETPIKHIGVVWAGSLDMDMSLWRNMPLSALVPLFSMPNTRWISLQKGTGQPQIVSEGCHGLLEDMSPLLTDIRETARIISQLDLVVSVCTSVGHLAAAMGKPTIIIRNRRSSDWRWNLGSRDPKINPSPWYPAVTVVEKDYGETWSDVVKKVGALIAQEPQTIENRVRLVS